MNVVIDASAAVGIVCSVPGAECFAAPLERAMLVAAPDLFVAEVCNALWKYHRADLLSGERCEQLLSHALALPDRLEPAPALYLEAFAVACRHNHPVYDALYLVLARRINAAILTMDRRLAGLARDLYVEVVVPE